MRDCVVFWGAGAVIAGALSFLTGCGSGTKSGGDTRFPTRVALEKLAATPIKPAPIAKVAPVPQWRVDPQSSGESSPAEAGLASSVDDLQADRSLRCAAHELARFRAEHEAAPNERVSRFITGACGLLSTERIETRYLTAPAETTDEDMVREAQKQLAGFLPKGTTFGASIARGSRSVVLMVLYGKPASDIVVSAVDETGTVTIQGTTEPNVELALAFVNHGRDGVVDCAPDRSLDLPRFAFRCTLAEADPWAWIQVAVRDKGRILMRGRGLVLARRDPNAPIELTRERPTAEGRSATAAVLDGVNRARQTAGLAPLALATRQATMNAKLAGHFFHAEIGGDVRTADTVALGLLAGWDVDGVILNGGIYAEMLSGTNDAAAWLEHALDLPMGRHTLLQRDARQVAIGIAPAESIGGMGVVVSTYSFFSTESPEASVARVVNRLTEVRAARGLSAPRIIQELPPLTKAAQLVSAGERDPESALRRALDEEYERTSRPMSGWLIQTHDLNDLPFAKELVTTETLWLRVAVTHFRPEGSPWGAYVVYFVRPVPVKQRTASTKAARSPVVARAN